MGEFYDGVWYRYPPLRNAILAGLLIGLVFLLFQLNIIPLNIKILIYLVAIPIGAYHWVLEGLRKLIGKKSRNRSVDGCCYIGFTTSRYVG